jgi:hypothetical protein
VRDTRGVVSVINQLTVNGKGKAADSSQVFTDAWITTKVKSVFFYSSNVSASDVDVNTLNGVVTLKGKVETAKDKIVARNNFNASDFYLRNYAGAPQLKPSAKQLKERAKNGVLGLVCLRLNGQGEERIKDWVVVLRLEDVVNLLREAGYGEKK